MSVLTGDSGKSVAGVLKTFNFTYPIPREDLQGTPQILPTTEPATSQCIYTIQQSDLPTITPTPKSVKWTVGIVTSGKAISTATPNYRILKNGASVTTAAGSSVAANNFWALTHWRWLDVQVGDVLEVRLWSTVSDTNYDYSAIFVYPTNVVLTPPNVMTKDVTIVSSNTASPSLTQGTPSVSNFGSLCVFPTTSTFTAGLGASTYTLPVYMPHPTQGFCKVVNGDTSASGVGNHATSHPLYQKNSAPISISFREMLR